MYKIEEKILQATLNYLATRPYSEVVNLISALQISEKLEDCMCKDECEGDAK